jgi:hypothetical protein
VDHAAFGSIKAVRPKSFSSEQGFNVSHFRSTWVGATDLIHEFGHNDLYPGSDSLATLQAEEISSWKFCGTKVGRVWQTTLTPKTTSTDSFATTANQTISKSGQNTVRTDFNDWLRDGAPMSGNSAAAVGTSGAARYAIYSGAGALVTSPSEQHIL